MGVTRKEGAGMAGNLSFEELSAAVGSGTIDTVLVAMVDMQGRLIGKRFQAEYFVDGAHEETHGCDYLLANDIDMEPVPGYAAASWDKGYGDFVLKPDLATLRKLPWLEGTALVLADVLDHHHHDVPHSPRAMLKRQVERLAAKKMRAFCASELEFYLFDETYQSAAAKRYRGLETAGSYIEDYHILQTTKEEGVMRAIRRGLQGAGIPVENSKGEWGPGQEEINVRYADALEMADRHVILKNAIKEIAHAQGKAVTFMAKWRYDLAGSSAHIHLSLWDEKGAKAAVPCARGRVRHVGADARLRGRAAQVRARHHLFPGALHQLLQALPGRHLRADQGGVEPRQPHRGLPPVRGGQQGDPHRVPHRRRRPQSLSGVCGADRGGLAGDRGEADARAAVLGRCLCRHGASRGAQDLARGHASASPNPSSCARPLATPWSSTTCTPPSGSSSNTTAASPTGSSCAGSSAPD